MKQQQQNSVWVHACIHLHTKIGADCLILPRHTPLESDEFDLLSTHSKRGFRFKGAEQADLTNGAPADEERWQVLASKLEKLVSAPPFREYLTNINLSQKQVDGFPFWDSTMRMRSLRGLAINSSIIWPP